MRYLPAIIFSSLFIVACKSEKAPAPTEVEPAAKPAESKSAPAPTPAPASDDIDESAKMDRTPEEEDEKAKLVDEAAAEGEKVRISQGIPVAEAAMKELASGSFDYAMIDPSSAVAYADFAANPPIKAASCGAPSGLEALAAKIGAHPISCTLEPSKLVRCSVSLVAPDVATTVFDRLIFDFEIVQDFAHLRAVAKEHLDGTPEQRTKMFAEHDAALVALGKKRCADAH